MTFDELKDTILRRARPFGMCESFHDMINATDYDSLIIGALPSLEYGARTGILSYALIEEFDATTRENHGVYYGGTFTLTAPPAIPSSFFGGYELWVINANVTVTFAGAEKYKINVINGTCTITAGDTASVQVVAYNSTLTLNGNDESLICANVRNFDSEIGVTANMTGNARLDMEIEQQTQATFNFTDTPFVLVKASQQSIATVNSVEDDDFVVGRAQDTAQINYLMP